MPTTASSEAAARRSLLAYVEGAIVGTSFEYELTSYYEMIGVNQLATPSHADPTGFGAIMSALPERVSSLGEQTYNTMYRGALRALETTTSGLFQMGTTATLTALSAYLAVKQPMLQNGPTITEL
jgi:hypothetical protein